MRARKLWVGLARKAAMSFLDAPPRPADCTNRKAAALSGRGFRECHCPGSEVLAGREDVSNARA